MIKLLATTVTIVAFFLDSVIGQLTLSTHPVIFGRTVALACDASSVEEFQSPDRIWNGGKEYGLLVVNGVPTNPWKYKERTDSPRKRYIMEITDFQSEDVNELYSCTYGFVQYKINLTINADFCEYHPNKSEIKVSTDQSNERIALDLDIHTIFPIPKCSAKYNDGKQSENSAMNITKNGIFYKIHFQSNISLENKKCDGKVEISCMTGSTDIPMYSESVNHCQRITSSDVVVGIVVSIGIVMVILITMYCIVQRTSCRNKLRSCMSKLNITHHCLQQNEQPIIDFSAFT